MNKTALPVTHSVNLASTAPLLFVLLWSTGFIGAKFGLPYAEPMTFLVWRFLAVLILMLGVVLLTRAPWPSSPRGMLHIAVTGLLIHAVYLGGVFISMHEGLPSGIAALVVGLHPLLTAVVAGFVRREPALLGEWGGGG